MSQINACRISDLEKSKALGRSAANVSSTKSTKNLSSLKVGSTQSLKPAHSACRLTSASGASGSSRLQPTKLCGGNRDSTKLSSKSHNTLQKTTSTAALLQVASLRPPSRCSVANRQTSADNSNEEIESAQTPDLEITCTETQTIEQVEDLPYLIKLIKDTYRFTPLVVDSSGRADSNFKERKDVVFIDLKRLDDKVNENLIQMQDAKEAIRKSVLKACSGGMPLVLTLKSKLFPFEKYFDDKYFPRILMKTSGSSLCTMQEVYERLIKTEEERANLRVADSNFHLILTCQQSLLDFNNGNLSLPASDTFVPITFSYLMGKY